MYEKYFGLTASPFQLNPDPSFLFESKGHRRAHAYLSYGVFQAEGFIVVTGEVGAGKTTLVRHLLRELDREKVVAAQLVSTQLEADDLLRSVAIAFGVPTKATGKAELLGAIEAFLLSLVPLGQRALLVVDEAQNLSPRAMEELRMLSNFQLGQRALLQSFLVGQPELREIMRGPSMQQLRQRIIASYHLGPLEERETRLYVEHRLAHAGWKNDPVLEDALFEPLHRATGGIPRRINAVCNRLMLGAFLSERHRISLADLDSAVAELREELGSDTALAADAPLATPLAGSPAAGLAAGAEGRPGGGLPPFLVSSIIARLDRIERNVAALVDWTLINTGGDGARPGAKPAAVTKMGDAAKSRMAAPVSRMDAPKSRLSGPQRGESVKSRIEPQPLQAPRPLRAGGK
jgi:putative secretion ATPase (PEP-CTERM system associated)